MTDHTHRERLLIDLEVWEFAKTLKRAERRKLEEFLHFLAQHHSIKCDATELDEVGREIELHIADRLIIRVWRDPADRHLKVLNVSREVA